MCWLHQSTMRAIREMRIDKQSVFHKRPQPDRREECLAHSEYTATLKRSGIPMLGASASFVYTEEYKYALGSSPRCSRSADEPQVRDAGKAPRSRPLQKRGLLQRSLVLRLFCHPTSDLWVPQLRGGPALQPVMKSRTISTRPINTATVVASARARGDRRPASISVTGIAANARPA